MSFPRYQEYKDSGENGLEELPSHWIITRFSRIMLALKDGTHGSFQRVEEGEPLLSAKNVLAGHLQFGDSESLISQMDHNEIVASGFPAKGDVLLTIVGTIGRSCVYQLDYPMAFQRSVCFIRLMLGHSEQFIYYFTQSKFFQEQLVARSKSSAQAGIYMGDIAATTIAFPPNIVEQTSIAAFLDCETAKIDVLIAEQEKLITLLAEKRQATISHAVTRGLNSNAAMKDSGVAWLGEVPAHWKVKKLRFLIQKNGLIRGPFGGDLKKEIFVEKGIKVYEQKNAIYKSFELGSSFITPNKFSEMQKFAVFPGDYIMSCSGTIGETYRIPDNAPPGIINQALLILRFQNCLLASFTDWLLIANFFSSQIIDNSQGGAMKNLVGMDIFTSISVPVPPTDEQSDIANHLSSEINKLDNLVSQSERGISLLQERRSALITAAVTGQIDVRGLVEPQSS